MFGGKLLCCCEEKLSRREETKRQTSVVVLLDYIIIFGLGVSDGFNIYARDQRGRVSSSSFQSKNSPFYDLSKE